MKSIVSDYNDQELNEINEIIIEMICATINVLIAILSTFLTVLFAMMFRIFTDSNYYTTQFLTLLRISNCLINIVCVLLMHSTNKHLTMFNTIYRFLCHNCHERLKTKIIA